MQNPPGVHRRNPPPKRLNPPGRPRHRERRKPLRPRNRHRDNRPDSPPRQNDQLRRQGLPRHQAGQHGNRHRHEDHHHRHPDLPAHLVLPGADSRPRLPGHRPRLRGLSRLLHHRLAPGQPARDRLIGQLKLQVLSREVDPLHHEAAPCQVLRKTVPAALHERSHPVVPPIHHPAVQRIPLLRNRRPLPDLKPQGFVRPTPFARFNRAIRHLRHRIAVRLPRTPR